MAEQATTGIVQEPGGASGRPAVATAHDSEHFSGRPISWFGTGVVCVGFVLGAVPFFLSPIQWWLFWAGVAVTVVGALILAAAKTMSEDWY